MCAGYITASLCTWNYRRMWFFKWSFDRSRCIMPTNRSLTDDHRLITLINAFIRARDQRTYRALRGRTVQVLRGPTPITAPSLEVRCVLIRGDALWSCDPNPGFFFWFFVRTMKEKIQRRKSVIFHWATRAHWIWLIFFSSPKISLVKKGKNEK